MNLLKEDYRTLKQRTADLCRFFLLNKQDCGWFCNKMNRDNAQETIFILFLGAIDNVKIQWLVVGLLYNYGKLCS